MDTSEFFLLGVLLRPGVVAPGPVVSSYTLTTGGIGSLHSAGLSLPMMANKSQINNYAKHMPLCSYAQLECWHHVVSSSPPK